MLFTAAVNGPAFKKFSKNLKYYMKRALIGYGGHAREVAALLKIETIFVEDNYLVDGVNKLSTFDVSMFEVMVAIADPVTRKRIVENLPKETKFFSYIHPTSIIFESNCKIGEGSYIGPFSVITTNINIGKHAILNRANQIGHDTNIKDFLTMMPGSIISGNCEIGNNFYIGTNSCVREKVRIIDNIIIGLESGVVKDIYEQGTYGGTPCKKLK